LAALGSAFVITRKLARMMGWRCDCGERTKKGSVFTVRLPGSGNS
jgi:signal transduction histidine kinase